MANSQLIQTMLLLYRWQPQEVDDLESDLEDRMKGIWRDVLRARANEHGCPAGSVNDPRGRDLREIRAMAHEDAVSISNTWARAVENQLNRLYNANPRGNRNYYSSNMERWATRRGRWKNLQIGLATEQRVAWYASDRFRQENGLRGQLYLYAGPAPVGDECKDRWANGISNEGYIQAHPTPAHPNCPHRWIPVNPINIGCEGLWVG